MRYLLASLLAVFAFAGAPHAQEASWEGGFPVNSDTDLPQQWEGAQVRSKTPGSTPRGTEMPPASSDLAGLLDLGHRVVGVVPWGSPKTSMVYLVGDRGLTTCVVQFADSADKLHQLNQCFEFRR